MITRFGVTAALLAVTLISAMAQGTAPPPQMTMSDMMKMHQQMMSAMHSDNAKLDALLKEMDAAVGDAKVKALAAVVTELARQHRAAYGQMAQMHQGMMMMMSGRGTSRSQ